jgi:hypothetical protein
MIEELPVNDDPLYEYIKSLILEADNIATVPIPPVMPDDSDIVKQAKRETWDTGGNLYRFIGKLLSLQIATEITKV